jgi:hypothetical protein
MLRLFVAFSVTGLMACYDPKWAPNIACGEGGSCPDGLQCGSDNRCHAEGDGTEPDSSPPADARSEEADAREEADASPVDPCIGFALVEELDSCDIVANERTGTLALNNNGVYTYNTTDGELRFNGGAPINHNSGGLQGGTTRVRYLSAANIEIGAAAELRVIGDLPLLLVAWNDLTVDGRSTPRAAAARTGPEPVRIRKNA